MSSPDSPPNPDRRDFFKKAAAIGLGGLTSAVPIAAGVSVFLDPLRRKSALGAPIRVTSLDAVPADGVPRKFTIFADRIDAWNKSLQVPVGAIYLRRSEGKPIEALNVVCPHAGCFVDYLPGAKLFSCPCHNSTFALDGRIESKSSPSPRAMDSLEVEVRNQNEVWVRFQNFRAGHAEKVADV